MGDMIALDISGAGMRLQRERMAAVAENLANQHTTGPNGPYQRKQVVAQSVPIAEFAKTLGDELQRISASTEGTASVSVAEVTRDSSEPIKQFDPTHPHADAQGYVAYPNISVFREMTDMVEASRMYEANLAASRATREMLNSALDLIRK